MTRTPTFSATGVAPVLMTADMASAAERYQKMGFEVRMFPGDAEPGDAIYAFLCFDGGELHMSHIRDGFAPEDNTSACYLWIADAEAVFEAWNSADLGGRLIPPKDTEYGLREFAYIDPDGNLLRLGSPLK